MLDSYYFVYLKESEGYREVWHISSRKRIKMKVETKAKLIRGCSVCLVCLVLCGCYEEQSVNKRRYYVNQKRYAISTQSIIEDANKLKETDYQQKAMEDYTPEIYDALDYVHKHSTERMKKYISRGELVIGMNQKEVVACLHSINFRYGMPVTSKIFNSKYGKYETWIIAASSRDTYSSSYVPPKYTLDFTYYILTGIHET